VEDRREEKQGKQKQQRVFVKREFDVVSSGIGSAPLKAIWIDPVLSFSLSLSLSVFSGKERFLNARGKVKRGNGKIPGTDRCQFRKISFFFL
jgi:hypothetical protein